MKIFLDTASVSELKEGVALGVVDGVTTNPSLIAKEKRPFRPLVEEICAIVPGDVSLEVVATDFEGMVKEGAELAQIAPNVVVKCPLTKDGIRAVRFLTGKGIRVNQRSEEHTSELQSQSNLVCRLLLEKKKTPCIRVCTPESAHPARSHHG